MRVANFLNDREGPFYVTGDATTMTEKKEKSARPPKPIISRSSDYSTFYVTGAIGNFTPFDYRLTFYTHEEQWPEKPKEISGVPISQVVRVTVVMSSATVKALRDLLDRQLKEKEKTPEPKKEARMV